MSSVETDVAVLKNNAHNAQEDIKDIKESVKSTELTIVAILPQLENIAISIKDIMSHIDPSNHREQTKRDVSEWLSSPTGKDFLTEIVMKNETFYKAREKEMDAKVKSIKGSFAWSFLGLIAVLVGTIIVAYVKIYVKSS